jgi:hypothetical protein
MYVIKNFPFYPSDTQDRRAAAGHV